MTTNAQSPADVLKRFEGITEVIADSLRFKRKLAIGEDAYTSLKVGRALSTIWDVGGVAATGAGVASSSAVASTFFASSGILARIGIGAAFTATPIGWVVASAVVSGGVYYGVTRAIGKYAKSRVEVIPRFINSPIDQLGAALLDMMGTLALKVASMDGVIDPTERAAMRDYFVSEWGYDPIYADRALALLEEGALSQPLKQSTSAIARFVQDHPDCNAQAFYADLIVLLREIAEADGKLDEREDLAIDAIERAFKG
jgi:uncharacterized tellurite resistance protein B-like protein